MFDHERLEVYRHAMELVTRCDAVLQEAPRMDRHLRDQLDRASISVVLNTAEGAGEFSPDEKKRFYRMARRSAIETAAILDIVRSRQLASDVSVESARLALRRVVSMLVALIKR